MKRQACVLILTAGQISPKAGTKTAGQVQLKHAELLFHSYTHAFRQQEHAEINTLAAPKRSWVSLFNDSAIPSANVSHMR